MADISPKHIRSFFYAIEVNLLLWIAVLIMVWSMNGDCTRCSRKLQLTKAETKNLGMFT